MSGKTYPVRCAYCGRQCGWSEIRDPDKSGICDDCRAQLLERARAQQRARMADLSVQQARMVRLG